MGAEESLLREEDVKHMESETSFTEEEILFLHEKFKSLDTDGNGALSLTELSKIPQLAYNPLLERLMTTFGLNIEQEVEFKSLLKSVNVFNQGDPEEKLQFCFDVYDIDNDGIISNGELYTVLKTMVGKNLTDVQLQQVVDKTILEADTEDKGGVNFREFCQILNRKEIEKKMKFNVQEVRGRKKKNLRNLLKKK